MDAQIAELLDLHAAGRLSRRQLIAHLSALAALAAGVAAGVATAVPSAAQAAADAPPTFAARELNHVALRVTDLDRSERFYAEHLGLEPYRSGSSNRFLRCGPHFLALFRASEPGLDHYSYTIDDYDQAVAAEKLRAKGLEPRLAGQRIYFDDPDGIEVQVSPSNR